MIKGIKNIRIKITKFKKIILNKCAENGDDTDGIKDFRQHVFFVHDLIEERMSSLIVDKFLERLSTESTFDKFVVNGNDISKWNMFENDMKKYLSNLNYKYGDKLKLLKTVGVKYYDHFKELNDIRNHLGHPRSGEYRKYLDPNKMYHSYKVMADLIEKTEDTKPFRHFLEQKMSEYSNRIEVEEEDSQIN